MRLPLRIHTQSHPDGCTQTAISAIAEDVLQQRVDPEYLYTLTNDKEFGVRPEVALNAAIEKGVRLEDTGQIVFPFTRFKRIRNFFGIGFFDKIVEELKHGSLFCGCFWQNEWGFTSDGMLSLPKKWKRVNPHAFKVIDTTIIRGKQYLVIQNSRGDKVGHNGLYFAPKEVVNKFSFAYRLIV